MPINAFQMHVQIPYFTGIPEDVVTNVWSLQFTTLAPTTSNWDDVRTRLQTFYQNVYAVGSLLSAQWLRPALTRWKGYDLNDPSPRAPRYDTVAAITVASTTSAAAPETAVCLSFQGVLLSGTPQARRRGRIFLGGLATPLSQGSTTTFPEVGVTPRTTIAAAATALKTGLSADGWTWSVLSRMDDAMVTVDNGWIDNAADIQRRRGARATARTTFS
jgi:hypothetical protein